MTYEGRDRIPFETMPFSPPEDPPDGCIGWNLYAGNASEPFRFVPRDTEPRCLPERTCPAVAVFVGGWVVLLAFCGACFAGVAWAVRRWVL